MNAGHHFGNSELILENLPWFNLNKSKFVIKYFQVLNWLPDYLSLIDIFGKFSFIGIIDYLPINLPFIGKPSFNFFHAKNLLMNYSKNTIICSEKKLYHKFHFDSQSNFNSINNYWIWLETLSKSWIDKISFVEDKNLKCHMLYSMLAQTLHIVQDFYSHSNWIEIFHDHYGYSMKEDFPTWHDIFKNKKNCNLDIKNRLFEKSNEKTGLFTGYFSIHKENSKMINLPFYYHNDYKNHPGLNKDRAERPFFEVVYYLAFKHGIQWLNHLITLLPPNTKDILKIPISVQIKNDVELMHDFAKSIAFKLREWNGKKPFSNLKLEIVSVFILRDKINLKIKLHTKDKLIKYDRDFRKSFFKIEILNSQGMNLMEKIYKFGEKSGISNIKIRLSKQFAEKLGEVSKIHVEYGLLHDEKLIINQN